MPINYNDYPKDWATNIRPAILERAKNKCEWCGVHNYAVGYRSPDGVFWDAFEDEDIGWRDENYAQALISKRVLNNSRKERYIIIVLTVAHLDHDKTNNDYDNLKALCQKCHLNYDIDQHKRNSAITRRKKKELEGQLSLFEGV